jgi:branched-chain amino acid transport system ATP-binding protein
MTLLEVNKISTYYDAALSLDKVSLEINEGELIALIGSNGSGKSTLLKAIAGLVTPTKGVIKLFGKEIQNKKTHDIARLGVAYIPEDRSLFASMTINENLELGAYIHPKRKKELLERALDVFPELGDQMNRQAGTLSGGQRQMLSMAMGIMSDPKLYLIDEPSLGLSPVVFKMLFRAIDALNKEIGVTILLVEQDVNLALQVASRAYVLESHKIVMEGKSCDLLNNMVVRKTYLGLV